MLNNDDTVIAGTNLMGGGDKEKFDYNKMAQAMSKARIGVSIRNTPWVDADATAWGGDNAKSTRYSTSFA